MIVAVRHPKPDIAQSICYGRLDVALAEPLAGSVARCAFEAGQFDVIVSSPLRRAHAFALALAAHLSLNVRIEPRLQELNFGSWEGVPWADIPRGEIDAWSRAPLDYRPGSGETVRELDERVLAVKTEAAETEPRQLWVTHAGPMRCLYASAAERPLLACLDRRFAYEEALAVAP